MNGGKEKTTTPWRILRENRFEKVEWRFGEDHDTGRPTVEYIKIDKISGDKEHKVYIADDKDGWTLIHWGIQKPHRDEDNILELGREGKERKIRRGW